MITDHRSITSKDKTTINARRKATRPNGVLDIQEGSDITLCLCAGDRPWAQTQKAHRAATGAALFLISRAAICGSTSDYLDPSVTLA